MSEVVVAEGGLGLRVRGVFMVNLRDPSPTPSTLVPKPYIRGSPKIRGTLWGSHNTDYTVLGSILGSPHFGKLP